jgi:dolichol-phosphate mannosyltransferase
MTGSQSPGFDNTHIVIPTYNERGNIVPLVEEIVGLYQRPDAHIWVVDDNSPDGTAEAVRRLGARYPNVRVIVRLHDRGYGNACVEGMRAALAAGAQWVLTMDADFAHSPGAIAAILKAAADADLVIGSRYLTDGRPAVKDWPWWRLWMSRSGNWYFRRMLRVTARDNTSGFRCWRAGLLSRVLAEDLRASGYAFITESLFYAGWFGARVAEVSNLYLGRTRGESKLSARILLESLWTAFRLRAMKAGLISGPRTRRKPAPNPGGRAAF